MGFLALYGTIKKFGDSCYPNRLDYIYKHENSKMAPYSKNSSKQAWRKGSTILIDQPPSSFPSKKLMLRSE